MKVTIITSCYNREQTIRCCIESVLSQDNSQNIINEYKGKISKIISEPDHGMYDAINKGIRAATGDVIGLVHSDDFLFSNQTVSHIVQRFEETHADFLYGDGLFVNPENTDKVVRNWILSSMEGASWLASFASYLLYSQGCDGTKGLV